MIAKKLGAGSHIRVIAPARSMKIIAQDCRDIAIQRFAELGITVSYGKNVEECDDFITSSVQSRIDDLHEAFLDPGVDAIFTAIGGFSTTEILDYIDYDIIKSNPKIICGFSDITALCNAIYAKTGLITYSGPHFSSFGMRKGFDYTLEYLKKALFLDDEFEVTPCGQWADDLWFLDQENRKFEEDEGHWVINSGAATGKLLGGNNHLLNLLRGTQYMPKIKDCILFVEHCAEDSFWHFKQNLIALMQAYDFCEVKGLVIGRFQKGNDVSRDQLTSVIKSLPALNNIPVVANVSFGHTTPIITFPIGGMACIEGSKVFIK